MDDLIIFDDGKGTLSPLCDLRACFEIRTGALTTAERLSLQVGKPVAALHVPESMEALVAERSQVSVNRLPEGESFLLINGRWSMIDHPLPDQPNQALLDPDGSVAAAYLDREHAARFLEAGGQERSEEVKTVQLKDRHLVTRPWHVLEKSDATLDYDLTHMNHLPVVDPGTLPWVAIVGRYPVRMAQGATIHPHVVFDTSAGPICIEQGAEVRSMSVLVGPGYIGRESIVTNHAHIRGHTVIGPVCKVGGEVFSSIIQGYANKAHSGYLGNSYVGEWVNLGASTVTSNLKNTYGRIRMQLDAHSPPEPTELVNFGTIFGDHVKTAIGSRLLTGTCVQTGAMVAVSSFAPKWIRAFGFLTDKGHERYDFDRFCQVAQTMMGRRDCPLTPPLRRRLQELHAKLA